MDDLQNTSMNSTIDNLDSTSNATSTNTIEDMKKLLNLVSLLTTSVFLLLSLVLNLIIIINICYKRKSQIPYFSILIIFSFIHMVHFLFAATNTTFSYPLFNDHPLEELHQYFPPIIKSTYGLLFLLVASLTIERFLAATVRNSIIKTSLHWITCFLSIAIPGLVLAFNILAKQSHHDHLDNNKELWFGLEVSLYIILPLLILTIFGAINYCQVSVTSRLLHKHEVLAIKNNIGLTLLTNSAIFLFLVQECLELWQWQLKGRTGSDVESMLNMLEVVDMVLVLVLQLMLALIPLLFLSLHCCSSCCCPAITLLQDHQYTIVSPEEEHL